MLQKKDKGKILFFRKSAFEMAKLVFDYPNKTFHVRGVAKELGLSTTAVTSSVEDLKKFGIVEVEKTDLTTNIKAKMGSAYVFYKKIFNLYRLERYLIVYNIKETFKAETIVLFGSFAKGEDIEESDIDILVITKEKDKADLGDFAEICEKALNRKLDIHILSSLEKSSNEFKNSVANGIVLQGYLKVL